MSKISDSSGLCITVTTTFFGMKKKKIVFVEGHKLFEISLLFNKYF